MRFSLSLSLTRVELDFDFCQVGDTGVQALAAALQGLVQLTQVGHVGVARQRSGGGLRRRQQVDGRELSGARGAVWPRAPLTQSSSEALPVRRWGGGP